MIISFLLLIIPHFVHREKVDPLGLSFHLGNTTNNPSTSSQGVASLFWGNICPENKNVDIKNNLIGCQLNPQLGNLQITGTPT